MSTLNPLPLEQLAPPLFHQQVRDWVHTRWQAGQNTALPMAHTVSACPGEPLAKAIYAVLTSHRFCKHRPGNPESFHAVIQQALREEKPIPIILGHGPLKNRNGCASPQADWAELFTFYQLACLHQRIRALHPPGLSVSLYLDDARSERANGVPPQWTAQYFQSLVNMLRETRLNHLIPHVFSFNQLYIEYGVETFLAEAEVQVLEWEADPRNEAAMAEQRLHAQKNVPPGVPVDWTLEDAAHRYRVYLCAEHLAGLWEQPNSLYARYSPHPGFWQLFTLRKGQVGQPWQGEGCLLLNPHGKLEPFLLTAGRKHRYEVLDVVETEIPFPGFDRIPVVVESLTQERILS